MEVLALTAGQSIIAILGAAFFFLCVLIAAIDTFRIWREDRAVRRGALALSARRAQDEERNKTFGKDHPDRERVWLKGEER